MSQHVEASIQRVCEEIADEVCALDYRSEIANPKWLEAGRVHDWRNYVPESVRDIWAHLDTLARLSIYLIAVREAAHEHWD